MPKSSSRSRNRSTPKSGSGSAVTGAQPPTHVPPSPGQNAFIWGCVGAILSIVIAVVAAMIKDVRWILFFAWPFAAVAVREFAVVRGSHHVKKWAYAGAFVSGFALLALYKELAPDISQISPNVTASAKTNVSSVSLDNEKNRCHFLFDGNTVDHNNSPIMIDPHCNDTKISHSTFDHNKSSVFDEDPPPIPFAPSSP